MNTKTNDQRIAVDYQHGSAMLAPAAKPGAYGWNAGEVIQCYRYPYTMPVPPPASRPGDPETSKTCHAYSRQPHAWHPSAPVTITLERRTQVNADLNEVRRLGADFNSRTTAMPSGVDSYAVSIADAQRLNWLTVEDGWK